MTDRNASGDSEWPAMSIAEAQAERLTWLDKMLIAEQQDQGIVDLRPDAAESYTVRANRHLLIDRAKRLERYDLATETEPGRWTISDRPSRP